MTTEYGSRLRQARKSAKLTQAELSKKTGVPQSTISTAEREGHGSGETPVYARACGVNALWLATGEGEMFDFESNKRPTGECSGFSAIDINNNRRRPLAPQEVLSELAVLLSAVEPGRMNSVIAALADLVRSPADEVLLDSLGRLIAPKAFTQKYQRAG